MSAPERESPRILLKARPLPQQLADRLAPPAPDGMELYIHEADVTGDGWLEALSGHIGAAPSRTRLPGSWRGRCGRWTGSCSGSAATPPWTAS